MNILGEDSLDLSPISIQTWTKYKPCVSLFSPMTWNVCVCVYAGMCIYIHICGWVSTSIYIYTLYILICSSSIIIFKSVYLFKKIKLDYVIQTQINNKNWGWGLSSVVEQALDLVLSSGGGKKKHKKKFW